MLKTSSILMSGRSRLTIQPLLSTGRRVSADISTLVEDTTYSSTISLTPPPEYQSPPPTYTVATFMQARYIDIHEPLNRTNEADELIAALETIRRLLPQGYARIANVVEEEVQAELRHLTDHQDFIYSPPQEYTSPSMYMSSLSLSPDSLVRAVTSSQLTN